MSARPRPPHAKRFRSRLGAAAAALAVTAAGLLATPSEAAPAPEATTAAQAAVEIPTADVLDVSFAGGAAVDEAQSLAATTSGEPTYGTDPDFGDIMSVDGVNDAVGFDLAGQYGAMSSSFSIECVFRIDAAMPQSPEKDLCSNKEAGGFSIYVTGPNLGTMAHIGGGYKSVLTPIDGNRWYHALSVWDGSSLKLYVNGRLAGETAATGAFTVPPNTTAHRFVVGGDSAPITAANPSGVGQWAPPSSYRTAKLYSAPLNADQAAALAAQYDTAIPVPAADALDVDFAGGTPTDHAQDLAATTRGNPVISEDAALGKPVATFDGVDDSIQYAFAPHWPMISNAVSIECTFKYDGAVPTSSEKDVCSGKEGGGYSIYVNGTNIGFMAHIGGGYKNATAPNAQQGRWFHVVGVWTGTEMQLYVNGELAATTPATGALGLPAAAARGWTVGADTSPTGTQFYAPVTVSNARLYGRALGASDIAALEIAALGEFPDARVEVTSTTPAAGSHLSAPVEFAVEIAHKANATGWTYTLDGEPITPGQEIGEGLAAGDHLIVIEATDVFGEQVREEIPFTSDSIPGGGGTGEEQGEGSVALSAIATSPDGSDVTTTFREATATTATGGFTGSVAKIPSTLEFAYDDRSDLSGKQKPDDGDLSASVSTADIPFQRFDVTVPGAVAGQQVLWSGVVDPARAASLRVWNATEARWVEIAQARGVTEGETVLRGKLRPAYVDGTTVHAMVLGIDPFADDLAPRDASAGEPQNRDHFEDPADYDFSLAHFTDTQYLAEGAAGGTYDDFDGNAEPTDRMKAEERALWQKSYLDTTEWIVDNAAQRKIAWTGHTGDVIENDYNNPLARDVNGNLLYPGLDEQVTREFDFTSEAQSVLDEAGVVNQVVAGNHDNQLGNEIGPDSRFNQWYGPERYYAAEDLWPAGTEYHAYDESSESAEDGQDNQNNYLLFSAGGLDFVAVGLSYGVTQEEADWASAVFERYPDRNGILITHAYIAPSTAPDGRGAGFSGDGSRLYNEVVADNKNVFLILAGHEHGVGTNVKSEVGVTVSHNVVELLADYQFYKIRADELFAPEYCATCATLPNGDIDVDGDGVADHKPGDLLQFGASWLRLLQFDVEKSQMSIDTYSPMFDNFGATEYDDRRRYNGAEDNTVLPVDLTTRTTSFETDGLVVVTPTDEVIGTDTARSGWPATVEWSGLVEGEVYAWVADSRTASGDRIGTLSQFGTVFVATAAGSDVMPPEVTLPSDNEIEVGEAFDPLAGVTATDNTDGDVTDLIEVVGSVDTTTPGTYALTYVASDANGNQVLVPRAVRVVTPTEPELVDTSVSVANQTVTFGQRITLRAQVSPAAATGTIEFLNGEDQLCEGTVTNGAASCIVQTPPPPGDHAITAVYSGDQAHEWSQRAFVLTVKQPSKRDPRLVASAADTTVPRGRAAVLTATTVSSATGKVTFTSGGRTLCVATIRSGRASCETSARLGAGIYKVVASYPGDDEFLADRDTFSFRKARRR